MQCGLGFNPINRYESRASWGLPAIDGKDKILLPRGLLIATRRRTGIMSLTIRRADWHKEDTRPKYWQCTGSANMPLVLGKAGLPVVLLESALDAILLWQEAGDLCATVATFGSTKPLDTDTAAFINAAPLVLACPDFDAGGKIAWQRWKTQFPHARLAPPVGGKDLGEMHNAAPELDKCIPTCRKWLEASIDYNSAGRQSKIHNVPPPRGIPALTKTIAEQAGYLDLNQFKAALTGELIPCPRHGWKWLYKTWCASKCVQRHKDCIFVS